ncbi:MAG: ABC transporter ATP-binding protein [Desulfurococcaceae archaeon]
MTSDAIEAFELRRRFGDFWAVRNATFTVKRGSVAVLAGPNGAGKTTTVRMLTTVLRPSKGSARVVGFDVVKEYLEVRRRIAYMPQDYATVGDITPYEFITYSLMMRGVGYFTASREAKKWLDLLGLRQVAKRRSWVLSGGERRKMLVAATLAAGADVVFLDEPTTELDVESKYSVLRIIREASKQTGTTVLLTTHMLEEAQLIADQVVFINSGEAVASGTPSELLSRIPYKYKAIFELVDTKCLSGVKYLSVGSRVIAWTRSVEEARELAETCRPFTYSIRETTLEDAYLYIVGGEK